MPSIIAGLKGDRERRTDCPPMSEQWRASVVQASTVKLIPLCRAKADKGIVHPTISNKYGATETSPGHWRHNSKRRWWRRHSDIRRYVSACSPLHLSIASSIASPAFPSKHPNIPNSRVSPTCTTFRRPPRVPGRGVHLTLSIPSLPRPSIQPAEAHPCTRNSRMQRMHVNVCIFSFHLAANAPLACVRAVRAATKPREPHWTAGEAGRGPSGSVTWSCTPYAKLISR